MSLVLITTIIIIGSIDLEVSQLVLGLRASHHTNIITKIILLEELLGQILEIPTQEKTINNISQDLYVM